MIKDILVHIPTERPIRLVIDVAISLAQKFGAELDALSLGYVSTSAAFVVAGAAATVLAANLDLEQRRAAQRTAAALAVFDVAARNAGVSCSCRWRPTKTWTCWCWEPTGIHPCGKEF